MAELTPECGSECRLFLNHWVDFWKHFASFSEPPVAVAHCNGYYNRLRKKSQAMVRQAYRLYVYRPFLWDDQYRAVEKINLSKEETSEGAMRGWYTKPCSPGQHGKNHGAPMNLCEKHTDVWYGGFDREGSLMGYCRLTRMDSLANICYFFAAKNATGVLNGILAHMASVSGASYIAYHTMEAGAPGRTAFKMHTGFRPCRFTVVTQGL